MTQDISHKRHTDFDPTESKILELIEATTDSKDKAFLLILMKMNSNLAANTKGINETSAEIKNIKINVEEHVNIINRGKGSLTVITWFLGIAQAIAVWTLLHFNNEMIDVHKDLENQRLELTVHTISESQFSIPKKK